MNEKIKPATKEQVADEKKTVQPTKAELEKDDRVELDTKRKQLKDDVTFINGGDVRVGAMVNHVAPITEGIRRMNRKIEKLQIMRENLVPVEVRFRFETITRYKAIAVEELGEEQTELKRKVQQMEDIKKETESRVPMNQKRINELEKKLGEKLTEFKSEKADYIG